MDKCIYLLMREERVAGRKKFKEWSLPLTPIHSVHFIHDRLVLTHFDRPLTPNLGRGHVFP